MCCASALQGIESFRRRTPTPSMIHHAALAAHASSSCKCGPPCPASGTAARGGVDGTPFGACEREKRVVLGEPRNVPRHALVHWQSLRVRLVVAATRPTGPLPVALPVAPTGDAATGTGTASSTLIMLMGAEMTARSESHASVSDSHRVTVPPCPSGRHGHGGHSRSSTASGSYNLKRADAHDAAVGNGLARHWQPRIRVLSRRGPICLNTGSWQLQRGGLGLHKLGS